MLRTHKGISVIMTICLCIALLAPIFVAPPAAQAACTYQALSVPTLSANTAAQDLGIIQVDIDNCAGVKNGDVLTLSFSSEVNLAPAAPAGVFAVVPVAARTAAAQEIVVPALANGGANAFATTSIASANITSTRTTLDITFNGTFSAAGATNAGRLLIYLTGVNIGSVENEVVCSVLAPASSAFSSGSVVVGKISDSGSVTATVKSAVTFGSNGAATDTIIISETAPGVLVKATDTTNNVIKLKLPNGFTWGAGAAGTWNWGWAVKGALGGAIAVDPADSRLLTITVPSGALPAGGVTTSATGSGQIRFAAPIVVNDAIAKEGDVVAVLSDTAGRIKETELTVGKYASFSAKVVEGEVKDLYAGKANQKIGKFYIQEGITGSILAGRSIKLTLPVGVKWWAGYRDEVTPAIGAVQNFIPNPTIKEGATIALTDAMAGVLGTQAFAVGSNYATDRDEGRTIRFSTTALSTTKAKLEFDNLKVDIAPDFTGDVIIKVTSDAGVTGEVKVATVKPRVELKGENVKDIRIGEQNQVLGDLIITETAKEKVAIRNDAIYTNNRTGAAVAAAAANLALAVSLPAGASWGPGFPKVEVIEGDLQLDTASMSKTTNAVTGIATLNIPVKSESTKPSKIKISEMKATLNRTVPEGDFKVAVSGLAVNETGGQNAGIDLPFAQFEGNKAVVAKCVTPAPNEGTNGAATGQFRISSNIYQVNGVSKVMDAAPYVKDSRTYVPIRFLGYAMGLTDADIVWDATAQKVTMTKGDKKVELTVGSTTITVNGEAKTMDVAPEISSDRTMLPARFVAEGLGFQVGWDAATSTVLISK